MSKEILVTGGSGFIGKHLLKALGDRGANYDIKTTDQGVLDILDYDMLEGVVEALRPKTIVHLAAISNRQDTDKNPQFAIQTNVIGTYNVLKAAQKYKARVIIASSAATAQPELSLYGTTKDCMETLSKMFENVIIARFYNVYGPGSKSVVNKFIKAIKAGRPVKLNGNTIRDYIYVSDIVDAIIALSEAPNPNKVYDIGTHRPVSLNKLVSVIEKVVGKKAKVIRNKSIKEIQVSECLYHPVWYKVTLEQGIRRLL